ncbi:MAG: response regulator [Candidatus Wallbacteria bacterium]|nr:response regulator [Candidatus Wallbacteria bacterium]
MSVWGQQSDRLEPELPKVVVVDDDDANRDLLCSLLQPQGYEVLTAGDGREAIGLVRSRRPDIVLLDLLMPGVSGIEVCETLKQDRSTGQIPIVMLTGLCGSEEKIRSIRAGANDFITKPFIQEELLLRIESLIRIKRLHDELEMKNQALQDQKSHLEQLVRQRTAELEDLTLGLVAALERANSLNDTDTGNHIRRVCTYSYILSKGFGMEEDFSRRLERYASLHDVGKVAVPDTILKKPGRLTEAEIEEMKKHTVLGWELLTAARADAVACNVALYHHEKYDGSGYPNGLAAEQIPVEARIVALADVYDALTTKRCYKEAFSEEQADEIIRRDRGRHFDPELVDVFFRLREEIKKVRSLYPD